MEMRALVLVQHSYAGCVCAPRTAGGVTPTMSTAGAAAAGQTAIAIIEQQRRQAAARQRQAGR